MARAYAGFMSHRFQIFLSYLYSIVFFRAIFEAISDAVRAGAFARNGFYSTSEHGIGSYPANAITLSSR